MVFPESLMCGEEITIIQTGGIAAPKNHGEQMLGIYGNLSFIHGGETRFLLIVKSGKCLIYVRVT
jgi:hypothetical protein